MPVATDVTGTYYGVTSDALVGYGVELLIGDGASPETFEAVAGVQSLEAGTSATSSIDVTHLRSLGRHREIMPGIRSTGPFTGSVIWLPNHPSQSYAGGGSGSFTGGGLAKIAETAEIRNMKIRYDDGTSPPLELEFNGFIAEFTPSAGITVDGALTATLAVQPTQSFLAGLPA